MTSRCCSWWCSRKRRTEASSGKSPQKNQEGNRRDGSLFVCPLPGGPEAAANVARASGAGGHFRWRMGGALLPSAALRAVPGTGRLRGSGLMGGAAVPWIWPPVSCLVTGAGCKFFMAFSLVLLFLDGTVAGTSREEWRICGNSCVFFTFAKNNNRPRVRGARSTAGSRASACPVMPGAQRCGPPGLAVSGALLNSWSGGRAGRGCQAFSAAERNGRGGA